MCSTYLVREGSRSVCLVGKQIVYEVNFQCGEGYDRQLTTTLFQFAATSSTPFSTYITGLPSTLTKDPSPRLSKMEIIRRIRGNGNILTANTNACQAVNTSIM